MKALTLWRPWPLAILRYGKRVENRTWPAPAGIIGQRIVLHAGKKRDAGGQEFIYRVVGSTPEEKAAVMRAMLDEPYPPGSIFCTTRVLSCFQYDERYAERYDGWTFGPWCWVLGDVEVVSPAIPCKGMMGLWTVPAEIEQRLRPGGWS